MIKAVKSNNSGITLIALVVTIIVLMILAGIAVATLMGDNGIIKRAGEAKESQRGATVQDEVTLAIAENEMIDQLNSVQGTKEQKKSKARVIADLAQKGYLSDEDVKTLETQNTVKIGSLTIDFSGLPVVREDESAKLMQYFENVDFSAYDGTPDDPYPSEPPLLDAPEALRRYYLENYSNWESITLIMYHEQLYYVDYDAQAIIALNVSYQDYGSKFEINGWECMVVPGMSKGFPVAYSVGQMDLAEGETWYYVDSNGVVEFEHQYTGNSTLYRAKYTFFTSNAEEIIALKPWDGSNVKYYILDPETGPTERFTSGYYSELTGTFYDLNGEIVYVVSIPE